LGKFEIIQALKFGEDLFLENTLYIWKYFGLNIRAHSSCPQTALLSCGYVLTHQLKST